MLQLTFADTPNCVANCVCDPFSRVTECVSHAAEDAACHVGLESVMWRVRRGWMLDRCVGGGEKRKCG